MRVEQAEGSDDGSLMSMVNIRNQRLLQGLIALDDSRRSDEGERSPEMIRLESKLDLLLDMMAVLVQRGEQHLRRTPVRLAASWLEWQGVDGAVQVGEQVWVYLQIDPRLPQPLKLLAQVVTAEGAGEYARVHVRLTQLSEECRDLLEKVIFRYHRREIARMRASARGVTGES